MTEQEILDVVERCNTGELFCNECAYGDKLNADCIELRDRAFAIAKEAIAQRDALLTDLNLACGGKFVDVCCICGHYTPENPGEKCELKGLDCRWEWRGLQHG